MTAHERKVRFSWDSYYNKVDIKKAAVILDYLIYLMQTYFKYKIFFF